MSAIDNVITQIEAFIVANGNEEITADVLRPLLVGLADAVQQTTGDPADLNTTATDLVAAINEVLGIANNAGGLNILSGSSDPNENAPVGQELGAFYAQYVNSVLIGFWQYNGVDWIEIKEDTGGGVETVTGDGVDNTDPNNPELTFPKEEEIRGTATDTSVNGAETVDLSVAAHYNIEVLSNSTITLTGLPDLGKSFTRTLIAESSTGVETLTFTNPVVEFGSYDPDKLNFITILVSNTAGVGVVINVFYAQSDNTLWVEFPFNGGTEAGLAIETVDGSPWKIDWGDGIIETHPSSANVVNKNYGSAFTGTVRIKGNVYILESATGAFDWTNVSQFTSLFGLHLNGNGFTGDMSGVSNLTSLIGLVLNGNGFTGDMSGAINLPLLTWLDLIGNFTVNYTSKSWGFGMKLFRFLPTTSTNALDTSELDQLIIDLSETFWGAPKSIYADGNNGVRSSASDAAVSTLQGMGVTLYLN